MHDQDACCTHNLLVRLPACLLQCPASCKSVACKRNRVVSNGLALPLEVYYTGPDRGFGVRCATDILAGAYVCSYVGEIVTDQEAVRGVICLLGWAGVIDSECCRALAK